MERGYFLKALIILSLIWLAGCAGESGISSMTPSSFLSDAAASGMAEVRLGNLALTRSQNEEIKQFAERMIVDHTKTNIELTQLATGKSIQIPTELDSKHKSLADRLSRLSGAEFDREYVKAMVEDHEKSVKSFQMQVEGGTDAEIKDFAAKTLPALQMHLETIRGIEGKIK